MLRTEMRVIPEYLRRLTPLQSAPLVRPKLRFSTRHLKHRLEGAYLEVCFHLQRNRVPRVHALTTRNAATGTHIRSGKPLICLTFMPKISVTKENGTYRKASRMVICPCCAWSLMEPASMTLMEFIRRVKESMRNFSSTLVCSRISRKIKSGYPIYFEAGKPPFTATSSALADGGSHFKVILTCHSICNSSAR
jgi:hypothetical protein